MPYIIFKLVHVFAIIFFVGNIVIGIFWKYHGDSSGDPKIIASTMKGIIKADKIFTMPAAAFLILAGFGAAGIGYLPIFETGWILWGLIMIIISAAAFMAKVVPAQKNYLRLPKLIRLINSFMMLYPKNGIYGEALLPLHQ